MILQFTVQMGTALSIRWNGMKKLITIVLSITWLFADNTFVQRGVAPPYIVGGVELFGGVPYDAGRGVLGGTDLDNDNKKEVWITSYANGGQIFCFEETGEPLSASKNNWSCWTGADGFPNGLSTPTGGFQDTRS